VNAPPVLRAEPLFRAFAHQPDLVRQHIRIELYAETLAEFEQPPAGEDFLAACRLPISSRMNWQRLQTQASDASTGCRYNMT
jgi:hypothetical protein